MRTYDFSPLFRYSVGFDRVQQLLDAALERSESAPGYPPYNIESVGENAYRITMAVAGFGEGDIDVTVQDNTLTIKGKAAPEAEGAQFLYRGIAGRAFERRFQLAEHVEVEGAKLENGLLHVDLVRRIPETLKPRRIEIGTGRPALEQKQAA